jgi:hypothetical protein
MTYFLGSSPFLCIYPVYIILIINRKINIIIFPDKPITPSHDLVTLVTNAQIKISKLDIHQLAVMRPSITWVYS